MSAKRLVIVASRWSIWPIIVLILASFVYVGVNVPKHREFSPYDEYVYLDYLAKVPTQLIVHKNEQVGEFARNEISCRGVVDYGEFGERCDTGSHRDNVTYPYAGYSGADIYSPAYFAVTWAIAQPLTWIGLDLLDAGRMVGALWLAGGLIMLYGVMRRLKIDKSLAVGLNLLVMISPAVYWADTYLSTDAASLAAGAAVALVGVLVAQRRIAVAWLIPLAIVVVLFKVQNLTAVVLVGLALMIHTLWTRSPRDGSTDRVPWHRAVCSKVFVLTVTSIVAGAVAQVGWLSIRAALAGPLTAKVMVDITEKPLTTMSLTGESFKFLFSIGFSDLPSGVTGMVAANVLTALSVAGVVGLLAMRANWSTSVVTLAFATLIVALAMGPALAISTLALTGSYFPLPIRYGIILLPAFVICAGLLLSQSRRSGVLVLVVSAAMAAVVIAV